MLSLTLTQVRDIATNPEWQAQYELEVPVLAVLDKSGAEVRFSLVMKEGREVSESDSVACSCSVLAIKNQHTQRREFSVSDSVTTHTLSPYLMPGFFPS